MAGFGYPTTPDFGRFAPPAPPSMFDSFGMFGAFAQMWILIALPIILIILYQAWAIRKNRTTFAELRSRFYVWLGQFIGFDINPSLRSPFSKFLNQLYMLPQLRRCDPEPSHFDIASRLYTDYLRRNINKAVAGKATIYLFMSWFLFIIIALIAGKIRFF